jgi:hypothetical protein
MHNTRKSALIAASAGILFLCLAPMVAATQAHSDSSGGGGPVNGGINTSLILSGANSSNQILIGQMMTVTIDAPGVTSSNYTFQWSLSTGGSPFASWSVSQAASLPPVPYSTPPTNSTSLSCFFSQPASQVTVSCTVTPIGNNPPVTLSNSPLTVVVMAPAGAYIQETEMSGGAMVSQIDDQKGGMLMVMTYETASDNGIDFQAEAITPSGFYAPQGDPGGWDFWQTAADDLDVEAAGGNWYHDVLNNTVCLDTRLPYDKAPPQTIYTSHEQGNLPAAVGTFPAVAGPQTTNDSPCDGPLDSHNYTAVDQSGEVLEMYQMYCPPSCGGATCFVPLQSVLWMWYGDTTYSGSSWSSPPNPTGGIELGCLTFPSPFPTWSAVWAAPVTLAPGK